MSLTLGVSFTITGTVATSFTHSTIWHVYSGTWPTALPMPRSLMPCGQPKFSSMPSAPVSSVRFDVVPCLALRLHHQRRDDRVPRIIPLDLGDLLQVVGDRAIADQLDVVEAHHPVLAEVHRAVAREDVDDGLADRLPDGAAPAGVERLGDLAVGVRRRAGREPKRIR